MVVHITRIVKMFDYRVFKSVHKFESYLVDLPPKLRKCFINFRLCNHTLPIEKGIWHNIDRNLRKCNLCLNNEIGDEFHYAFECPAFYLERSLIVPFMYKKRINSSIYSNVFNSTNLSKLKSLCKFLGIILDFLKELLVKQILLVKSSHDQLLFFFSFNYV